MTRKWIIGIALMVVIVGGLFFLGFIPLGDDNSSSMEITFYDADGNVLGRADGSLGIQSPSFEGNIHSLDVVVYFKVTTNIDYTFITSRCDMSIETRLNTMTAGIVHSIAEHRLGAINSDAEGTFSANYLMSTLLPDSKIESSGKENGWMMYFNAKVTSQVGSGASDITEVTDTCGTTLTLRWVDDEVTLESWFGNW